MGINEEILERTRTMIDGMAVRAADLGPAQTVKKYAFVVLKDIIKAVEEQSIQGVDDSGDKKAAAMHYMEIFFDTVVGPKISLILRPFVKQIFMYACSYAIDALVSYINLKLGGKFTELL